MRSITYSPINFGRWTVWGLFAVALIIAPLVFASGGSLSLLSLMGTTIIFALSYNMLLGQTGMLSFGHAVYSGLGAFFAIHAMNLAGNAPIPVPLALIPLIGGVAGLVFGVLFGYVTTKRSGTTFSMISLGIVELVFACSLMFPGFFGGEGGISANRVFGKPLLGITYGPQIQVYYLIALWLFISTVAMFAISHTPLGRVANAVRDNPERTEFIGYDTQRVRYLMLILSSFFAGVSGGLTAINFEIVSAENVSALRSGAVLLFTFIGGIGFFFGPILGAIVGIFLTVMLSEFTKAWQLYLGLFFILMVMYAPGGLAGLLMHVLRVISQGFLRQLFPISLAAFGSLAVTAAGGIFLTELLYQITLESATGSEARLFWVTVDTSTGTPWVMGFAALVAGLAGLVLTKPRLATKWGEVSLAIDQLSARKKT